MVNGDAGLKIYSSTKTGLLLRYCDRRTDPLSGQ